MDEQLRSLWRAARAAPADRELADRLRAALLRQRPYDPAGAAAGLDELEGVLATPAIVDHGPSGGWRRVTPSGRDPLPPRAPADGVLQVAWEGPGRLRYLGADLALLEELHGALTARDPATGRELWRVDAERPLPAVEAWEEQEERAVWLGWATAPWGAAALEARWVAELEQRRVGRWTPRGRTTERATVGRGRVEVEAGLRLVVGEDGRLSPTQPEEVREEAGPGRALLDTIALEDWHDELLALSLDPRARQLAVRWRDEAQDWAVFLVLGDRHSRATIGPAGWSAPPPDDPFQAERAATDAAAGEALLARYPGGPLADLLSGRKLRAAGPQAEGEAGLVVADGRLWLQLDLERVVVLA